MREGTCQNAWVSKKEMGEGRGGSTVISNLSENMRYCKRKDQESNQKIKKEGERVRAKPD